MKYKFLFDNNKECSNTVRPSGDQVDWQLCRAGTMTPATWVHALGTADAFHHPNADRFGRLLFGVAQANVPNDITGH